MFPQWERNVLLIKKIYAYYEEIILEYCVLYMLISPGLYDNSLQLFDLLDSLW